MNDIQRLQEYYQMYPPRLSYGGTEGSNLQMTSFERWPGEEAVKSLGTTVYHSTVESPEAASVSGYCMIDVCLDMFGRSFPEALPLHPQMRNHTVKILIYVDLVGIIRMRAIGGYSGHNLS